jgi:phosphoglycerate kinase
MATQGYLNLESLDLHGKKVFLRLDLNVPLKDGKVLDENRITSALPTLEFLIEKGAKVVVASHLGRPKTQEDRVKYSMEPIAHVLNKRGFEVLLMETPDSEAPSGLLKGLSGREIILLENLRFISGEEKNSQELAAKWAKYTEVYVNDAFGASHRAHASIDALAKLIPQRCYGFLIKKEMEALSKIKNHPESPFVLLTGGSKVSDKIPLLESFADKIDSVLIGGAMAYTFLKAQGIPVGKSLVEESMITTAKKFLAKMQGAGKKVYLPIDHIVVESLESKNHSIQKSAAIAANQIAVDIGPETRKLFSEVIKNAKTVFWNGPMGLYEKKPFHEGSIAMAEAMANCQGFTVVGGGDSAAAAIDSGFANNISHISTGGGASLEFIEGNTLPGLEALKVRITE